MNELPAGTTIDQARRTLSSAFRAAGIDTPDLDARVLVGHVLALDHAALISRGADPLDETAAFKVSSCGRRRLAGEPVSRIVGRREFWGMPFTINTLVLDPRADTEAVVQQALELIDRGGPRTRALRIADLGVGSGAILLALLSELPNARGVGTDITLGTLQVAANNARALALDARADFIGSDFGGGLRGPFDLVVSNPPYIRTGDIAGLPHEVLGHDPLHALDGGADGLDAYRAIAADAPRLLAPQGHLVVEIGAGQQRDVEDLFTKNGLAIASVKHDLQGIVRAIAAQKSA